MKTKIKQIGIALLATIMLVGLFQVKSSRALEVVPVSGCRYTGVSGDLCILTNGARVTNCANNTVTTSCGIVVPDPVQTAE